MEYGRDLRLDGLHDGNVKRLVYGRDTDSKV